MCVHRAAVRSFNAFLFFFFFFYHLCFSTQAVNKKVTCVLFYSLAQSYVVWSFQSRHRASCTKREPRARYTVCPLHPSHAFLCTPEVLAVHVKCRRSRETSAVPVMCTPNLYRNYSSMSIFSALSFLIFCFIRCALSSQNDAA